MKLKRILGLGISVAVVSTCAFTADAKTQSLYKSKCQGCHGADGKATTMGKKLGARDFQDPAVASMSEDDLENVTKAGKNKMPGYKGKLTDKQIDDLVKYIKELK
ncbi:MAG TPA: cytochrome c [Terriglobales bacterium]|nr:cytochrome c [Terriglobales bacterium]